MDRHRVVASASAGISRARRTAWRTQDSRAHLAGPCRARAARRLASPGRSLQGQWQRMSSLLRRARATESSPL
eukprot:8100234-Pyramimonas_sp.AAC.1